MPQHTRLTLLSLSFLLLQLSNASSSTTSPVEKVPRCSTADMVDVNSIPTVKKSINFWRCDQNVVHVRAGALTTLIDTFHEAPSFVFIPSAGFEYFEVLFRRGTRSTVFNTLKVSDVTPGQYIVRIVIKFIPTTSYTPNLAVEIGVTPLKSWRDAGRSSLGQLLEDDLWYANPSLKKFTCEGPPEPRQQELSQVIIRVQGPSEWQYITPKNVCPSEAPRNSSDPNVPSSDASRSFTDYTSDVTTEYVPIPPSTTRRPPSRTFSTPTPPPYHPPSAPYRPPSAPYHPPTTPPHSAHTDQGTRGPRLITVHAVDSTTEEGFPSEGFFEEAVKNGTGAGVMKLSTALISGIIGGLAILLLIIGCCVLFKHLNLRGSYGIHSNTYEAESSLHLRDSHYNASSPATAASSPATAASSQTPAASSPATAASSQTPAASSQTPAAISSATAASSSATAKPHPGAPSITISSHNSNEDVRPPPGEAGQVNPSMDISQEITNDAGIK